MVLLHLIFCIRSYVPMYPNTCGKLQKLSGKSKLTLHDIVNLIWVQFLPASFYASPAAFQLMNRMQNLFQQKS